MPRSLLLGSRLFLLTAAAAVIVLSWIMVLRVTNGLEIRRWRVDGLPLRYVGPEAGDDLPGVIIAHGFSGSQQIMLGYSFTLARAGYATLSFDFDGHGANASPLDTDGAALQANLQAAYEAFTGLPQVDPDRVALLGHSMGSGAVMTAGIERPEQTAAVVAVSPIGAPVTEELPPNLYLQAGTLEPAFAGRAAALLVEAGGASEDFAAGRARRYDLVPRVEHTLILFSPASHEGAVRWLNAVFDRPAQEKDAPAPDRRLAWYGAQLAAWLVALPVAAALARPSGVTLARPPDRRARWLLAAAPFLATLLVALINLNTPVRDLGGILVGGALAVWFLSFGFIWFLGGFSPLGVDAADLLQGILLFLLLTLAFGGMAHLVWAPWWMIPTRLARFPFFALAILPWQLAAAQAQSGAGWTHQALWALGQVVAISAGLLVAAFLIPGLGFITLVLPLLPVMVLLMTVAGSAFRHRPWAAAIGNALFFGWTLMVVFPLSGGG